MLELAALGLLCREPLHGYRLKQQLEIFMSSCISVNYGAIYPLLKRLETQGFIVPLLEEAGDAGTSRKVYGITPKGRDRWRRRMLEQPKESWVKGRARFIIKFFFFKDLTPEERLHLLEKRLEVCQARYTYLDEISQEYRSCDPYEAVIWKRSYSVLRSEMHWLQEQINQEQVEQVAHLSS
jgi:DNA-binding PadR family transcriptional regulator